MTKLLEYNINMNLVKTYNPPNKMNIIDYYSFNNFYYSHPGNGLANEKDNYNNYYSEKVENDDKNNHGGKIVKREKYIIIKMLKILIKIMIIIKWELKKKSRNS